MNPVEMSLNPTRSIYSTIGNICNNPNFLKNPEIILGPRDFVQEFHKIVFTAVNNIAYSSGEVNSITSIDIDNYLSVYPVLYNVWNKNQGVQYVEDAKQHANADTFKSDYDRLKKYSLLRNYVEEGVDVSDVYEYKSTDLKEINESSTKLESMSVNDIIEHYTQKLIKIRDDWNVEEGVVKDFKAGDDLDGLLERLREDPDMGFPFRNGYYNTLFRGKRFGKFLLRSGATGTGKTRQAIMDMCSVTCSHIYETGKGWVSLGPSYPALFISTELDKEEVQLIMLAFLTGISDTDIKNGVYDKGTELRLRKGIEILQKAPFFVSYIEDFSISDIEMKIEQYIINEGIKYASFDYIQMVPKLSKTMQQNFGTALREDQILVHFSAALKAIAARYDIFLESSTQLNRGAKEVENRDASSLRGGLATADKIDHGVLTFKATKQDKDNLKHILQRGFTGKEPNFSHWVYKNRSGIDHVIIWTYMDLGTMREEALFVTDYDYNLIDDLLPTEVDFVGAKKEENQQTTMKSIGQNIESDNFVPDF